MSCLRFIEGKNQNLLKLRPENTPMVLTEPTNQTFHNDDDNSRIAFILDTYSA